MPIDTRGFPPSREGAKSKVLKEIIAFLDGRIGESLKKGGEVHIDLEKGDEGSPDDESAEPPEDAPDDGPVEDEDEAKLLALAAKRRR